MDLKKLENKINIITNKLRIGKFDEVIQDAKLLIKKFSDQQILYNILSLAYQQKGENDKSIDLLTNALKKNPKNIFFLNNMGVSHYNKKNLVEAEYYFKRVLEINPNYINALNNLGNLKKDLDLVDEAKNFYKKSIKLNDNVMETHFNLGVLYEQSGNFEKSLYHYKKTLEINPKFTKADHSIALMTEYSSKNKHFLDMQKKLTDENLDDFEKLELYFALGKAYNDLEDYKNSFFHIDHANSLKKKITKYNIENDVKLFNNIKSFFSKISLNQLNFNKKKIIFILGMPRSGTSLVEQIISSHKNVYGGGEIPILGQVFFEKFENNNQLNKNNEISTNFYNELIDIQKKYIEQISIIDNSQKVFTDKAPLNFRWIGFILSLFPNSKIIHCKRSKMDNCWSIYKSNFAGSLNFSNNLEDLGFFHNLYEELMSFWNNKFKNKIYNLSYEDLVSSPDAQIKLLIKFCGLDWDPNCLEFHKNTKIIKTVSFAQARKPIYKSSINSSSKYLKYLNKLKSILKS